MDRLDVAATLQDRADLLVSASGRFKDYGFHIVAPRLCQNSLMRQVRVDKSDFCPVADVADLQIRGRIAVFDGFGLILVGQGRIPFLSRGFDYPTTSGWRARV